MYICIYIYIYIYIYTHIYIHVTLLHCISSVLISNPNKDQLLMQLNDIAKLFCPEFNEI